jgi:hypothetical protein
MDLGWKCSSRTCHREQQLAPDAKIFEGRQQRCAPRLSLGRVPTPWSVEDIGAAFVVKDSTGQKLACVYFEDEPGRRSGAKLLTKEEARRIAVNVATLLKQLGLDGSSELGDAHWSLSLSLSQLSPVKHGPAT